MGDGEPKSERRLRYERRRRIVRRRRWLKRYGLPALALVAVVALLVGSYAAVVQRDGPEVTAADRGRVQAEQEEAERLASIEPSRLAFLGDSWSCGTGSGGTKDDGYAGLTAEALGVPYDIFCKGGSGYTRDPADGTDYVSRVRPVVRSEPDVVVVQGSTNDYLASGVEIEQQATEVVTRLQERLPEVEVLLMGPSYTPGEPRELADVSRQALQATAGTTGVTFIDIAGEEWLSADPANFADSYHPTLASHEELARRLAEVLQPVVTLSSEG